MIRYLKFLLGFNGSNFTKKEKDTILEAIKGYEWHVIECRRCYDECMHMGNWLRDRMEPKTYSKLETLYHNHGFYARNIPVTRYGTIYFWGTTDYFSRQRAVELLRIAIIND